MFTGKRTMCGGYVNRDDFVSGYRSAVYSEEQIAARRARFAEDIEAQDVTAEP